MRIAIVVHDVGKQRGHDRYAAELATALAARHDVHVFAHSCSDIDMECITYHHVRAIIWPDILKMITFLISTLWMLRKHSFDIVHSQGASSLIHNISTAHFSQAAWKRVYQTMEHDDVGRYRQWYHRLVMALMARLEKYIFNRSLSVIALSDQVKRDMVDYYGVSPNRVHTVYNGVNIEEFRPSNIEKYRESLRNELGIDKDVFVLVFVGEFKRKGLRFVIEALSLLSEPQNTKLVVVQGGDASRFEALAVELQVRDSVLFVGHRNDVARFYAMSDVVVFPTLYEPFGFTITEAMATAIPVITSVNAGAAELIHDGVDGLLLSDPRDAADISKKLERLRESHELRRKIGLNGRACVEKLSWRKFAGQVEDIYERAQSHGRSKSPS
ncbi:MAG: glycosyltransferase family 4 protein [Candidatus Latescibacteria bacterium]|jgi:UDP-glucose:(heptosyl)LPS alpha-1,3-glucosyltransferase|nr:glycosyltransferase family 4 protein [Candidatus Latescibacterota bacterium]